VFGYAPLDGRTWHREQLLYCSVERLKFLRRTRHLASSVALFLWLGLYALAQSPRQEQSPEANPQGNSPTLTIPTPPARQVPLSQPETTEPDQQPWYRNEWALWIGEALGGVEWSNWALLGAAIWAGRLALRTLRTQTTQIKVGRSALNASRRAADAAKQSADVAQQTMVISHRAYLHIIKVEFGPHIETQIPTFVLHVINSGVLTADLTERTITLLVDEPLQSYNVNLLTEWHPTIGLIAPNNNREHAVTIQFPFPEANFTKDEWKRVLNGRLSIAVYGAIRYTVGFPNVQGESGFAFTFDHTATNTPANKRFSVAQEPGYNYAK
jgi:hypothetical protein